MKSFVLILLLSTAAASAVLGQAIEFNIPVELKNILPEAKQFRLYVYLTNWDGVGTPAAASKTVPIEGGAFSGVVKISVPTTNRSPSTVGGYKIVLRILNEAGNEGAPTNDRNGAPYLQVKTGTPFVVGLTRSFGYDRPGTAAAGASAAQSRPRPVAVPRNLKRAGSTPNAATRP